MQVILAPSAALAATLNPHITIEAEYGSVVIKGSLFTAAHHQPELAHRPAPCNDQEIPVCPVGGTILVSHFDLDTAGGTLRAMGVTDLFEGNEGFWNLAEFVDLNGPHKLAQSGADRQDIVRLNAFWAWSKINVFRYPRDQVTEVTELVTKAGGALRAILAGDQEMLQAGLDFETANQDLNQATFERLQGKVIVRVAKTAKEFCNHLYETPDGDVAAAVACLNLEFGSVTISLADQVEGLSCREVVQELWGLEAGGHDGIAGSPRGVPFGHDELEQVVVILDSRLEDLV